jgi:hypothetical protein
MGDSSAGVDPAANKAVVARAVELVVNGGDLDAVDELYDPGIAAQARAWVAPFRASFPDVQMAVSGRAQRLIFESSRSLTLRT